MRLDYPRLTRHCHQAHSVLKCVGHPAIIGRSRQICVFYASRQSACAAAIHQKDCV